MVAEALALALDPVRLAHRVGIRPDRWQADLLRSDARQAIVLCSRQAGKSTTCAIMAAHEALFRPGSLTLIVSPSQRQSGELFRKVRDVLAALGEAPPPVEESALRLTLGNGSRVVSLPAKEQTVRGYSGVDLLIEDEASRVSDPLHHALRPMLAVSGGRLILLSTPAGRRGHFYEAWEHGGEDWLRIKVTADEVPRIPVDWLAAERRRIPRWAYEQEYLVRFIDDEQQWIGSEHIEAAADARLRPLWISGGLGGSEDEDGDEDPSGAGGTGQGGGENGELGTRIGPWETE